MKPRSLFFVLLSILMLFLCSAVDLQYIAPNRLQWKSFDGIQGFDGSIYMIDGTSVFSMSNTLCQSIPHITCIRLMDSISAAFYGIPYTPSRPDSNIEDFHSNRQSVIQYLKNRFDFKHYLEIGVQKNQTFGVVEGMFEYSVGVDPVSGGTHRMTSDEFFQQNQQKFDLIFVDGLHTGEQVFRDVTNSLAVLEEGGIIVMHDLNPRLKELQVKEPPADIDTNWNGDCWRAALALRMINEVEIIVVDIDHGVGVLRRRTNSNPLPKEWAQRLVDAGGWTAQRDEDMKFINEVTYEEFDEHREVFLQLVSINRFREWLEEPFF